MQRIYLGGILILGILYSCVTEVDGYTENSLASVENDDGKVRLADPYILVYDGIYYAYGTTGNRDFYTYVSSDLKYWEKYETPVLDSEDSYGEKWFWAPEVYYDDQSRKFYMYYSAEMNLCVASSDSPLGSFKQIGSEPMIWRAIDPTLCIGSDGNYLCYVNLLERSYINMQRMRSPISLEGSSLEILSPDQSWEGNQIVEGPNIVHYGSKYIMTYSGNDWGSPDYGIGVAVADDPMGPWEKYEGNPVFRYPSYKGTHLEGTGHNSLFKDLDGNWRMVFHAHSAKGIEGGRYMYIVSCELQDTPPYIIFKDDIFPARLISEKPGDSESTNKK